MLRNVVLPAPLGPMMARFSPSITSEIDAVGGDDAAEADLEPAR